MAPLLDSLAEDRLAHLFRTPGANGTPVAIEVQALLVDRQAAIVEKRANFAFGVLDHSFVEDAMNAPGQHGVEMRQQRDIIGVVATEFGLVVAEHLAPREVLLEHRKAAAERMAARIDEARVRQNEMDQADMQEIVRHLVDEEGSRELALDASALEIFAAERFQLRRAERRQYLGIDRKSTRLNSSHRT